MVARKLNGVLPGADRPVVPVLAGFLLVIALMVAMTFVCLHKMAEMRNATQLLITDYDRKASLISRIRWNVQQRILLLRNTFLITDPFELDDEHMKLQAAASESYVAVSTLNAMPMTPRQRELMDAFIQSAYDGIPAYNEIMLLHSEGKQFHQLTPLLKKVFVAQEQAVAALDQFDATLAQMRSETIATADASYEAVRATLLWLSVAAVLLASAIMGYIVRWNQRSISAIKNEREKLRQAEADVRRLNTTLEQRVQDRTASLQAAIRELEAFSYSVSHDLKSPLRAINGYCNVLQQEYGPSLDDAGNQCLTRITSASLRMNELLEGLLMLSRVFRRELVPERLNLTAMATEIVQQLREENPGRDAEVRIAPDLSAVADAPLIRLMLENLLENAWKFSGRQPLTRIEMGKTWRDGEEVFFVRDNGSGFEMEYAAKLFQPFVRLHSQEEFAGTGIGLATVRRIIQRHGGDIWVEAGIDAGATFYFTLPDAD